VARRRLLPLLLILALAGASGCARVLYNFGSIQEDRIYRSAQPSPLFLRWLVAHHGIRSLVNLRGSTPGHESAFAARNGLRLFSFSLSASRPPSEEEVERFLAILKDPENHPVLVHCRRGVDRTGYMLGIYRVDVLGWDADRAAREMNRYLQFEWANAVPQEVLRGRRAESD
jgi:protein tyrosine/serine phosphatase